MLVAWPGLVTRWFAIGEVSVHAEKMIPGPHSRAYGSAARAGWVLPANLAFHVFMH